MPTATLPSPKPTRPVSQRRRPEIRVRVFVLPESATSPDTASQTCLLDDAVFTKLFGLSPRSATAAISHPLYLAVHIPSLAPPKASDNHIPQPNRAFLTTSPEDLDPEGGWKVLAVRPSSLEKGAETLPSPQDASCALGALAVPSGIFSSLGASTGGNAGTGRNRGVGVIGLVREACVMKLERVVVCVKHPASERVVEEGRNPENASQKYLQAVEEALKQVSVVREGDGLVIQSGDAASSLATIELAEPVRQGILGPGTQVVVRVERTGTKGRPKGRSPAGMKIQSGRGGKTIEFDSIREEDEIEGSDGPSRCESESEGLSGLSDEDEDDSVMALAPATSVLTGFGMGTGIATPGSMISTFTSGQPKSAIFGTKILASPVQKDAIVPFPGDDDDDDGMRIFARPGGLVRVGVMAGDWVWIENTHDFTSGFGLGDCGGDSGRAVRMYSVPGSQTHSPPTSSTNDILLSPFLYGNLGCPRAVRISRLIMNAKRVRMGSSPPVAAEVRLVRIASQAGMDKRAQAAVVAGVKRFFGKRRLVSQGDLVAIEINVGEGEDVDDSVGPSPGSSSLGCKAGKDVVWFRVAGADGYPENEKEGGESAIRNWGCAAVDPSETTLVQAGAEQSRVFGGTEWREYLGLPKNGIVSMANALQGAGAVDGNPLLSRLISLFSVASHPAQLLPPTRLLLTGKRLSGKSWMVYAAAGAIGMHVFEIDCWDILANERDVQVEGILRARIERAVSSGVSSSDPSSPPATTPAGTTTAILLRNVDALGHLPLEDVLKPARLVVGTASPDAAAVDDQVRSIFSHELELSVPGEKEREGILKSVLDGCGLQCAQNVKLGEVARKTAALVAGDLVDLVSRAETFRQRRIDKAVRTLSSGSREVQPIDAEMAGGDLSCLSKSDFDSAVDAARKNFADAIGAPKIPTVTWDDVGGLSHVRAAVTETIQLPLARPELFASGLKKRSGILFYGPPGTGKTLVAKAIATEYGLNFFSVKGPELLNMYIGESEANVRRVFQRARDARPCVVFFDELDSVAPKRGNQGDSGGVMDRIVAQLLAELDGMSSAGEERSDGPKSGGNGNGGGGGSDASPADAGGVFVVGATNRPDLLDQALLRPGRFDKIVYLGLPETVEKRVNVMQALTRKFTLSDDVNFEEVVRDGGLTGADLYALCADAMLGAVGRGVERVKQRIKEIEQDRKTAKGEEDDNHGADLPALTTAQYFDYHASEADLKVVVRQEDFLKARRELVPSVSTEELRHYERVRDLFEGKEEKARSGRAGDGDVGAAKPASVQEPSHRSGDGVRDNSAAISDKTSSNSSAPQTIPKRDKGKGLADHSQSGPGNDLPGNSLGPASTGFGSGAQDEGLYDG